MLCLLSRRQEILAYLPSRRVSRRSIESQRIRGDFAHTGLQKEVVEVYDLCEIESKCAHEALSDLQLRAARLPRSPGLYENFVDPLISLLG